MPDQETPNAEPSQPDDKPLIEIPSAQPGESTPKQEERKRQPQDGRTCHDKNTAEELGQIRVGETWLVGVGIVTVVINVIIACIYYGQLTQMREATNASTKATGIASEALDTSGDQFVKLMHESRWQTKAQLDAAIASQGAATAAWNAVRQARDSARLDQRAWISPDDDSVRFSDKQVEGKAGHSCSVVYKNVGKTPAYEVWSRAGTQIIKATAKFTPTYQNPPGFLGTMHPGATRTIESAWEVVPFASMEATWIQWIKDGESRLYFYSEITYKDAFGTPRYTHFCAFFERDFKTVDPCDTYQDSN